MFIKSVTSIFALLSFTVSQAQQPQYTFKHFVTIHDTIKFKPVYPSGDGFIRTYILAQPTIWDLDDNRTTFIQGGAKALLCFEGQEKNKEKEGLFSTYLIDSFDNSKKYKIWEQTYSNGKLNGKWTTYTLKGTLVGYQTFKNDSLNGITRNFWIDGKTIMSEKEYFNGRNKFINREYYENGIVQAEIPFENEILQGIGKKYYENGAIKEVVSFKNGEFDGLRQYYYPNGQVWIEQIYKEGKSWTIISNYTEKGAKRNAGTLRNGNGTIIFYNEDGSVRETVTYVNGIEK